MKRLLTVAAIIMFLLESNVWAGNCFEWRRTSTITDGAVLSEFEAIGYDCSCGSIQKFIYDVSRNPDIVFVRYEPSDTSTPGSITIIKKGTGCFEFGSFRWCSDQKDDK